MVGALLQVCAPVILDGRVADVQELCVLLNVRMACAPPPMCVPVILDGKVAGVQKVSICIWTLIHEYQQNYNGIVHVYMILIIIHLEKCELSHTN
jgi:hypothetical protein